MAERWKGENNPNHNRSRESWDEIWAEERREKQGRKLRGIKRSEEFCQKQRDKFTPEMRAELAKRWAGKPPPPDSMLSVTGYYKGIFFRSSCELRFLLQSDLNIIKSAEYLSIPYIKENGDASTYHPDFLDTSINELIEIKAEKKPLSNNEMLKREAGITWCEKEGYTYKIILMKHINSDELFRMRDVGDIESFNKRWEKKYRDKRPHLFPKELEIDKEMK